MSLDVGRAADGIGVGVVAPMLDAGRVRTVWLVARWDGDATQWVKRRSGLTAPQAADFYRHGVSPYDRSEVVGNLITTAGWTRTSNLLTNQGATQALDATHTRIGAGDGAGTAAAGDTDLSAAAGSTHRFFQLVGGAGTVSTNTLAFTSTFGTADGNFAWNEFGVDVGNTSSGTTVAALLYNHKTSISQGTKAAGQTWAATVTFTYT